MSKTARANSESPRNFTPERKRSSRRGQATVEYVLMIGFAAMIGLAFLSTFNQIVNQSLIGFNAVLERELIPTGFPEAGITQSMWSN